MADSSIKQINLNDTDEMFRQKCNENFQASRARTRVDGILVEQIKDAIQLDIESIYRTLLDRANPIGRIIITNDPFEDILSIGRWQLIQGKFIVGADSEFPFGSEGGEKNHTLTIDELPEFTVEQEPHDHFVAMSTTIIETEESTAGVTVGNDGMDTTGETTAVNKPIGGDQPFDILPPYVAKYIFERIG